MSVLNQAADELKRFAVRMQGILQLADALEKIDSIDVAVADCEKRIAGLRAEEATAKADVSVAKGEASAARKSAADIVQKAKSDAASHISKAETAAAAILAQANKTNGEAENLKASILSGKHAALVDVDGKVSAATKTLNALTAQTAEAQEELSRVNAIIAEAKARFGG
jgi:chromosome segregation ATPase